jgi:hypothetical protein
VATWAQTGTVLAADPLAGDVDPRRHAPGLLRRALAALPAAARAGRVRMRADAGYFAGELARAAHAENIEFAIGAKRMDGAQLSARVAQAFTNYPRSSLVGGLVQAVM